MSGRRLDSRSDEDDVRQRPGKHGSRPRTRTRPAHGDAVPGLVVAVDRGRMTVRVEGPDGAPVDVTTMRARELGKHGVVVGDRVRVVGDTSGRTDSLARIVAIEERATSLRRTADDTDPTERIVVANADLLVVVTAVTDPEPAFGFLDRCLVAAYAGGLAPLLCLTKTDLASPQPLLDRYAGLGLDAVEMSRELPLDALLERLADRISVLVGQSGVGKSTLVNRLVPDAFRATGDVSKIGKGRHTSSSVVLFDLPGDRDGHRHPGHPLVRPRARDRRRRPGRVRRARRGHRRLPPAVRAHRRGPRMRPGRLGGRRPPGAARAARRAAGAAGCGRPGRPRLLSPGS